MKNFNKISITIVSALAFILVSCSGDSDPVEPVPADVNPPATYSWLDDNGEETVSFGGQTTRLHQAAIICSKMGSSEATFSEIDEMFNLGEGFSDPALNFSNSPNFTVKDFLFFVKHVFFFETEMAGFRHRPPRSSRLEKMKPRIKI